jgi:hypothetical protein
LSAFADLDAVHAALKGDNFSEVPTIVRERDDIWRIIATPGLFGARANGNKTRRAAGDALGAVLTPQDIHARAVIIDGAFGALKQSQGAIKWSSSESIE